jgi:intracellular septation protein
MQLSEAQWRNATWSYVGFFVFKSILNLLVAYNFTLEQWVKYKVFGTIILSLTFMMGHAMWLQSRQLPKPEH